MMFGRQYGKNELIGILKSAVYFVVFTVIWTRLFVNLLREQMVAFQVPKEGFSYVACALLMIIILIIRRVKLLYPPILISLFIGIWIILNYVGSGDWGAEYARLLYAKYATLLLFWVFVIDVIRTNDYVRWSEVNKKYVIILVVTYGLAFAISPSASIPLICPFLAVYLTHIDKAEWKKQTYCISIAFYLAFAWLMTKSLVSEGLVYVSGRYLGNFQFPFAGGLASAIAIVGVVYFSSCIVTGNTRARIIKWIITVLFLIYPIISTIMFMNRTTVLSLTVALLLCMLIRLRGGIKGKKTKIVILSGIIVLIVIMVVIVGITVQKSKEEIGAIDNAFIRNGATYINGMVDYALKPDSIDGVFPDGSILNALNRFSSGRLGLWHMGIRNVTLWGGSDSGVVLPDGTDMPHTHSTYINWLLQYGAIGGTCLIIWIILAVCFSVRKQKKNTSSLNLTTLWIVFCTIVCITERMSWLMLPLFVMLILQYPLVMKNSEQ